MLSVDPQTFVVAGELDVGKGVADSAGTDAAAAVPYIHSVLALMVVPIVDGTRHPDQAVLAALVGIEEEGPLGRETLAAVLAVRVDRTVLPLQTWIETAQIGLAPAFAGSS